MVFKQLTMKYITILFVFFTLGLQAQITDADLTANDTLYVAFESSEIESVVYHRANYVEITEGFQSVSKSTPEIESTFLLRLARDKEQWEIQIATIDEEVAKLLAKKAMFEAIVTDIDTKITALAP